METDELPAETTMCEESTVIDFRAGSILSAVAHTHDILRDATETDRLATISDCREAPVTPQAAPARLGKPLPGDVRVELAFDADIDSAIAAAGDPVSATVVLPLITFDKAVDLGAKVTGRIVRIEHQLESVPQFLVSIAFDTLQQKGSASPFYAKLIKPVTVLDLGVQGMKLTGHGLDDWPHGMFGFGGKKRQETLVIPAGFRSTWVTVAPEDLQ